MWSLAARSLARAPAQRRAMSGLTGVKKNYWVEVRAPHAGESRARVAVAPSCSKLGGE